MEEYGLEPDEVAFLDDQEANVTGEGVGVALILDPGFAVLHRGPFSQSQEWVEVICGLPAVEAPAAGSDDDEDDDLDGV